jgi:CMP-N-acetylneuraminic acid synthetase
MKEITCIIQARIMGNKRVPKKMIKPFAGSSLIRIALEKVLKCKNLDKNKIYLSAYEDELKEIAYDLGIQVYDRSLESVQETDEVKPKMRDVYGWAFDLESEYFLMIGACNPMLKPETIDRAIEYFQTNDIYSLFSVVKKPNFFFDKDSQIISKYMGSREHREYFYHFGTQWVEPIYEAAHSIYLFETEYFRNNNMHRWSFTKNDPYLFEISDHEAFDIDYPWQFELAEAAYITRFGKHKN